MKIVSKIADLPHPKDQRVGLVPTMGALHEGHLDLMRRGRQDVDQLVVSIFVNPTQFGKNEDYGRYPRNLERDAELVQGVGADILFTPTVDEVYPRTSPSIYIPEVTERWEGAFRPGHFEGVATVVAKLFNMVRPDVAYFGQKDLQQCAVIRRMTEDLNFPVGIVVCPTTREADGLAMSSRNAYLSEEERAIAPLLYEELTRCASIFGLSALSSTEVEHQLHQSRERLEENGFSVDYFEWVYPEDLAPARSRKDENAMIVAARLGKTRLIDNVIF